MKNLYLFICICFLKQDFSRGYDDTSPPDLSKLTLDCITVSDLLKSTAIACTQKGNYTLWKQIIDCHRPLPSKFLRESSEANCAVRKHVQDPTNWRYTLQEVFFNICGLVEEKNTADKNRGLNCLLNGRAGCPRLMSHEEEVRVVKCRFGRNVPCEIGECINNLNIGG